MQQDRESEFIPTETSPASIDELMNEFELSDAEIEQRAQEYETEKWSLGHERIYAGSQGRWRIFHAMTPPTKAFLKELGM